MVTDVHLGGHNRLNAFWTLLMELGLCRLPKIAIYLILSSVGPVGHNIFPQLWDGCTHKRQPNVIESAFFVSLGPSSRTMCAKEAKYIRVEKEK